MAEKNPGEAGRGSCKKSTCDRDVAWEASSGAITRERLSRAEPDTAGMFPPSEGWDTELGSALSPLTASETQPKNKGAKSTSSAVSPNTPEDWALPPATELFTSVPQRQASMRV